MQGAWITPVRIEMKSALFSVAVLSLLLFGASSCDFVLHPGSGDGGPRPPLIDGASQDGALRDGALRDGASRDGALRDGPSQDGSAPSSTTHFCASKAACWENPLPQGNNLYGVWGSNKTSVYAVGNAGTVLHFDGTSWRFEAMFAVGALMDVWGSSPKDVYVLRESHELLHYDGASWKPQARPEFGSSHLWQIWGSASKDVFVTGTGGTIAHYDGATWKAQKVSFPTDKNPSFMSLSGVSSSDVWTASYFGIAHFDGTTWKEEKPSKISLQGAQGIWAAGPSNLFVNGEKIYRFYGGVWSEMTLGTTRSEGPICGNSDREVYALRSVPDPGASAPRHELWTYDGTAWKALAALPVRKRISELWCAGGGTFFAVGDGGTILRHDKGKAWTSYAKGQGEAIACLWGSSATDVFAGQRGGGMLHRDSTGWRPMTFPPKGDVEALWGTGPSSVYASAGGELWHYDGKVWAKKTTPDVLFGTALWGRSDSEIYAAVKRSKTGSLGPAILRYDGKTWTEMSKASADVTVLWGTGAKTLYGAGSSGNIMVYDGKTWRGAASSVVSPTVKFVAIWGSGPQDVYVVGYHMAGASDPSVIVHYDGKTWTKQTIPKTSRLYGIWGKSAHEIYAVGSSSSHTMLYSDGKTWTPMAGAGGQPLQAIWGDGGTNVFVAGLEAAILHRH